MGNCERNLIKHCAQVYFTTNGLLLFHCILCKSQRLTNIHKLCSHLKDEHKTILIQLKSKQNEQDNEHTVKIETELDCIIDDHEELVVMETSKSSANDIYIEEREEYDDTQITQYSVEQLNKTDSETNEDQEEFVDEEPEDELNDENHPEDESSKEQMKNTNITTNPINLNSNGDHTTVRPTLGAYYTPRTNGEGNYKCPVCDRTFYRREVWSHHVRRHKKPQLECSHCSKKFHTRTELRHHLLRINGEKPFMCSECGRQFVTSGALTQHMRRHLNLRPCECDVCGKRFYDRGHLKHHYVVHTRERTHTCTTCNAKFARRKSLLSHMKIHANKREYVCTLCGADFNQAPGLHVHMRSKHKDLVGPKDLVQ